MNNHQSEIDPKPEPAGLRDDESKPPEAVPDPFDGAAVIRHRDAALRRNFLMAAAAVGVGSSFVAGTRGEQRAAAQQSTTDLDILNYALTLEYLESEFYANGISQGALSGRDLELVTPIGDHEKAHVDAVTQTIKDLGGTPVQKPEFMFPDGTFTDRTKFLTTASAFEELGVTAYHGQVAKIADGDILAAAASIAGVESRHAAVVAHLLGGNPFPSPMEKSMTMQQVLDTAGKFIKK